MSVILGINAYHAGASAALVIDGQPVAAIAEERLNRLKYYAGFPALAIRRCLDMAGLNVTDIDHVAIGREPAANRAKKIEFVLKNPSRLLNLLKIRGSRSKLDLPGRSGAVAVSPLECGAPSGAHRQRLLRLAVG
jgi:carbamoyltransferase